jgi:hypothetical protein
VPIDAAAGADLHPVVLDLHVDYVDSMLAKHEEHLQRFVSFIRDKLRAPSRGIQLCGGTAVSTFNCPCHLRASMLSLLTTVSCIAWPLTDADATAGAVQHCSAEPS